MSLRISDYEALIVNDTPLIDTRAPIEFQRGSLPSAFNAPLLNDQEREKIGRCYKASGQDAAIALGHTLISGVTKDERIAQWQRIAIQHPEGALMCFRGGLRSSISQQWLTEAGISYPVVEGGYKAVRSWLLTQLQVMSDNLNIIIIAGKTGVAKTDLITRSRSAIDLEGCARHRGSAFGKRPIAQPSQIDFENMLITKLIKHQKSGMGALILEDESRLIGRCAIPLELHAAMQKAPIYVLEGSLEDRVKHSHQHYILDNLSKWIALKTDPKLAFQCFSEALLNAATTIKKRLGGDRHRHLMSLVQSALSAHEQGDTSKHEDWIEYLLTDYYDPMYAYQLSKRADRVVFKGFRSELEAKLEALNIH